MDGCIYTFVQKRISMRQIISYIGALLISFQAAAQQIPRTVVAEHFTNTYCSVCASRNPGLFTNLAAFPQVLHIAYYPSSPYPACPLSMHNASESDARTNYYGIYGSTPHLLISGTEVSSFTPTSIYSSQLPVTTSFAVAAALTVKNTDSIAVRIVVKKVDTSSLTTLALYSAALEDTVFFTARNGETKHVNVFRSSFWGTTSLNVSAPVAVGDSSVYEKTIARKTTWNINRIYAVAILQQTNKNIVQAARSANISDTTTAMNGMNTPTVAKVYPNPATNSLFIDGYTDVSTVSVTDVSGRVIKQLIIDKSNNSIDISSLQSGSYILKLNDGTAPKPLQFIK
jgi:hypothetical protein